MGKQQVLKDYLDYKRLSVTTENKIKDISRYINKFLESNKKDISKFEEKDLIAFINSLGYKTRSMNDIKVGLKNFIKWKFEDYSIRFRNLDKICRTQKPEKSHSSEDMLKESEVKKLIEGEKELMWKVYWLVFFFGGFRPSEVCALERDKIKFESKGVIIKSYSPKTKKTFTKSLPEEAEHFLKEWLSKNETSKWVFPSTLKEGKHIHVKTAYGRLIKLSKKVLGKPVPLYILRHSFATIKYNDKELKKKGVTDDDIANQLGHTKNMKDTYLNLDDEQLKANARLMWSKAKKHSPEKEKELEKRLEHLENFLKELGFKDYKVKTNKHLGEVGEIVSRKEMERRLKQ